MQLYSKIPYLGYPTFAIVSQETLEVSSCHYGKYEQTLNIERTWNIKRQLN